MFQRFRCGVIIFLIGDVLRMFRGRFHLAAECNIVVGNSSRNSEDEISRFPSAGCNMVLQEESSFNSYSNL